MVMELLLPAAAAPVDDAMANPSLGFGSVADMIPASSHLLLPYEVYNLHLDLYELHSFRFDVLDGLKDLRIDLQCSSAMGPRTPVLPMRASRSAIPWSVFSPALGLAWMGFSSEGLANLFPILKLYLSSGVMLCLEVWYNTIIGAPSRVLEESRGCALDPL